MLALWCAKTVIPETDAMVQANAARVLYRDSSCGSRLQVEPMALMAEQ